MEHQVKMIMAWNFEKSRTEELQVELNKVNFILYSQLHLLPDLTSFQNNSFNKVWIKT